MARKKKKTVAKKDRWLSLSEFRQEVGLPLVMVKRMVQQGTVHSIPSHEGTTQIHSSEVVRVREHLSNPRKKWKLFFQSFGPGLITGASDDDPSGIGTYSMVGAKFGYATLWMAVWLLPMMFAIQEVCARIGIVTNKGLAGVLQQHYKKKIVMAAVLLLIVANIANIGADLGAMASALEMLLGINFYTGAVSFALFIILLEIFVEYRSYVKVLKWLTLSVLAYVVVGFMVEPQWREIFKQVLIPKVSFSKEYLFAIIAIFGTTITPYLFFWQTSEEVEENKLLKGNGKSTIHKRVHRMRADVGLGMILANIVFFFIVFTSAKMFFEHGIHDINSAEEAAIALKPLGNSAAHLLFAVGIIGTGLLAVPILAGAGAYALAEVMNWKEGLELRFNRARGFYLVIALSIIVGLFLNFLHINPISALYYSAYLNGIIALPLLAIIMIVGNDKDIMGNETHPRWVKFFGWMAVIFMALALSISLYMTLK